MQYVYDLVAAFTSLVHAPLPFITMILVLLFTARLFGELAERIGVPSVVGEITAGILLGPSILNLVVASQRVMALADLGVFLLMMLAGMQYRLSEIRDAMKGRGMWSAVMAFAVPLAFGLGVGALGRLDAARVCFLGLCLAITALSVSLRTLIDLGKLHTPVGQHIVSAAVISEIVAILLLGVVLDAKAEASSWGALGPLVLRAVVKTLVLAGFVLLMFRSARSVRSWVHTSMAKLKGPETIFAVAVMFVLLFAGASELMGLRFVIGAFFGAMLLNRDFLGPAIFSQVYQVAFGIAMGFLAPIFFVSIGLQVDLTRLDRWGLLVAIVLAGLIGKILGGYLGGRLAGLSSAESRVLGLGLNGRGMVEIIIAGVALENGFIGHQLFTMLVLMGVITTAVMPFLLKWGFRRLEFAKAA